MENKYNVSVYLPYFDVAYDLYVPSNCKVGFIKKAIFSILINNNYKNFDIVHSRLIDRYSGLEYNLDISVYDSLISNGTKLILM